MYLIFQGNTCLSRFGSQVKAGAYFTPIGSDVCTKCQCIGGQAVGCYAQLCAEPTCGKFKYLDGKCCEFECLEGILCFIVHIFVKFILY